MGGLRDRWMTSRFEENIQRREQIIHTQKSRRLLGPEVQGNE